MLQYICINPRKTGGSEFMYRLKGGASHRVPSPPLSWSKVTYLYCIVMANLACSLNKLDTNFSGIWCYGGVSLPPPPTCLFISIQPRRYLDFFNFVFN